VLLLEDLHWIDQASLDLLQHLVSRLGHLSVLLVATYRDDEVTRHHLLFRHLHELTRDGNAQRVLLQRLDRTATEALIRRRFALADADLARLTTYIFTRSEGNPLFASELLQALAANGTLRTITADDDWVLGDVSLAAVPPLVQQVIEARLARLSPAAREVVDAAAVIGEDVSLDVLTRVVEFSSSTILPGVEEALDAHVLVEADAVGILRFTHGLVRDALRDMMSPLRRRNWHQRVAMTLAAQPRPDPDAVAHHFQQAGDDRVLPWLLRAGQRAERTYAFVIAAERYAAALALLGDERDDARLSGWILLRIGTLVNLSDHVHSLRCYDEARRIGNATGDRMLVAYARARSSALMKQVGDVRAGMEEMRSSVDAFDALSAIDLPDDPRLLQYGLIPDELPPVNPFRGELIRSSAVWGRVSDAIEMGEAFVSGVDESMVDAQVGSSLGEAWYGLATAYAIRGNVEKARRASMRSREWYERLGDFAWVNNALSLELWIILWYMTDQLAERNRLAAEANEAWHKATGALSVESAEADTDFWIQLLDGRWDAVERQAPAGLAGHALITWRIDAVNALSTLAIWRGNPREALRLIQSVNPDGAKVLPGTLPFIHTVRMLRIAATASLDIGDLDMARSWLQAHDRWTDEIDAVFSRADGAGIWGRYFMAVGDQDRARESLQQAIALAEQPRQPFSLLFAHRQLGALEASAGNYAAAEQHLDVALNLSDACGAPFELAGTWIEIAILRIGMGKPDDAAAFLTRARAVCESFRAHSALARIDALEQQLTPAAVPTPTRESQPGGLSRRETDVLRLVARGLTDAEVARELNISPRTVSTHLTSVYNKLGVSSRHAATHFAIKNGLA
jgi:DNA-binding CsgD family transcriptional regulator